MKNVLTLMLCQTCMILFLHWNTKGDLGLSIQNGFFLYNKKDIVTTDCQALKIIKKKNHLKTWSEI